MTPEAMLDEMFSKTAAIRCNGFVESYFKPNERWHCDITQNQDGVKLEISGRGGSFAQAVTDGYVKWATVVYTGVPKSFSVALIEAGEKPAQLTEAIPSTQIDDDIPF